MTDPKRWVAIPPLTVENGYTYAASREKQDDEAEISRLARRVEALVVELNKAHKDIATLLEQLSDANARLNERSPTFIDDGRW